MKVFPSYLLWIMLALGVAAVAKPFLRVDIRNGMKVPRHFSVSGKTVPGATVIIDVESWDGFGAQFETFTDRKGHFSLPLSIPCKTVTTHVDLTVHSSDPRSEGVAKVSRYVIVMR